MQEDQKKPEDLASLWNASAEQSQDAQSPAPAEKTIDIAEAQEAEFKPAQETIKEKSKKELSQKPVEAEIVSEGIESEALPPEESFGEKMDELFSELNISRKYVFRGCACVILIAVLIYAGIWFFSDLLPRLKSKTPKEEAKKEEIVMYDSKRTGVYNSLLFGRPYLVPLAFFSDADLDLSILLGSRRGAKSQFANYALHLKQMQNAYSTDINAMLVFAFDRRSALSNHVARLKSLDEKGLDNFQKIKDEVSRYSSLVAGEEKRQEELEKGFFEQIKTFNPQSEDFLNDFITKAQTVVEAKARMRSLDQLRKYYSQALPRLEARIKDIELNREALISGLKVYDVKGSDLNLIIFEEGAGQAEKKGAASPLLSPIPTNSSEQDFVTKPTVGSRKPKGTQM